MITTLTQSTYNHDLTDEQLEQYRYMQDFAADNVANSIINYKDVRAIHVALSQVKDNNQLVNIDLPVGPDTTCSAEEHDRVVTTLNNYFNTLIVFTDEQKKTIEKGCSFFLKHTEDAIFILAVRSLLKQYAAFKSTNVLVNTKLIVKFPHRRILETFQFVKDVMDKDGLKPEGKALRSLQKLRLVHALIRARFIREKVDPTYKDETIKETWNEDWGDPINQQDMIFALHTFSVEIIDGLKAKGKKLSKAEIEDYYLTWHYYGKALGIEDAINPTTYKEGKALQERIYKNQFTKNNPNAKALVPPLIGFMKALLPLHSDGHIYAIVKLYNDKKDYKPIFHDILDLPLDKAYIHFIWVMKYADRGWDWLINILCYLSGHSGREAMDRRREKVCLDIMQKMVDLEGTWFRKSYDLSDAFGEDAAKKDEEIEEKEPNIFKRVLHKFFPSF